MFSDFIDWWEQHGHRFRFLKQLGLNFLYLHYLYIILFTLVGSIVIYGSEGGSVRYIDCLFFSSGASTQSGLNTIDFNKMNTAAQVFMYFQGMLCNPIAINTFVVFVRLYWFEKRFQHVVRDLRNLRRTKSRTETTKDGDQDREEKGVRGKEIVVLHDQGRKIGPDTALEDLEVKTASASSSDKRDSAEVPRPQPSPTPSAPMSPTKELRAVDWAAANDEDGRVPQPRSAEHHIALLQAQRTGKGTLRIPSPREYDRGGVPEALSEDEEEVGSHPARARTNESDPHSGSGRRVGTGDAQHITINAPEIPRTRTRNATFQRTVTKTGNDAGEPGAASFMRQRSRRGTFSSILRSTTHDKYRDIPYLSWTPTIGRNSAFVDLTEDQREELGGVEYRSLKTLQLILIFYFVGFHLFGAVCLTPWILETNTYGKIVKGVGQNRTWWGIFTAASAFNDLGFTLTPDSMISFQTAVFPLLLCTFLIIIGNTGFPIMLRFVIWLSTKCVPRKSTLWEELHFLLDHPRRCFTLLFPKKATWWLFAVLVILNGLDLIFFIILDLGDETVTALSPGIRFLDGLFQAASTRTAGFAAVNLADLHPAIQVSYLVMMYISVLPIAISVRRTNVYEERSLGIYGGGPDPDEDENSHEPSYIGAHLRKQLSFDLWYVFLGLFFIACIEGHRLENTNEYAFTLFSVLFEIVSAYGTVGLSLGYPGINASFSAEFKTLSKLIIIAMQIRGRHRGLPYQLDRAVMLPSEKQFTKELADAEKRHKRRDSNVSNYSAVQGVSPVGAGFRPETGLNRPSTDGNTGANATPSSAAAGMVHPKDDHPAHRLRGALGKGIAAMAKVGL